MEFRCFVRGNKLVGLCQRNPETVYPELLQQEPSTKSKLLDFIHTELLPKIASLQHLPDYVADLYIPSDSQPIVIDINPWR